MSDMSTLLSWSVLLQKITDSSLFLRENVNVPNWEFVKFYAKSHNLLNFDDKFLKLFSYQIEFRSAKASRRVNGLLEGDVVVPGHSDLLALDERR